MNSPRRAYFEDFFSAAGRFRSRPSPYFSADIVRRRIWRRGPAASFFEQAASASKMAVILDLWLEGRGSGRRGKDMVEMVTTPNFPHFFSFLWSRRNPAVTASSPAKLRPNCHGAAAMPIFLGWTRLDFHPMRLPPKETACKTE